MPMVWASASDIVSTVEDAARPNIAANPSRESAFRREIPSDPIVLLMLEHPGLGEVSSCTQFQRTTLIQVNGWWLSYPPALLDSDITMPSPWDRKGQHSTASPNLLSHPRRTARRRALSAWQLPQRFRHLPTGPPG